MLSVVKGLAKRRLAINVTLMLILAAVASQLSAQRTAPQVLLCGPDGECLTMTSDELARLPVRTIVWSDHGTARQVEGVEMVTLLERVGLPVGKALRGKALAHYVVVEAADGYRVAFGLAELDPAVTGRSVLLAGSHRAEGLAENEGSFRLVVQGDLRGARSVRQVTAIRVYRAQ